MNNEICIICELDRTVTSFRLGVETTKVEDFPSGTKANVYPNVTILKYITAKQMEYKVGTGISPCFTPFST